MTRLRWWVSISFLWLALLFNIERLHEPFNIASFVYVLAAVLGAMIVALPPLKRISLVGVIVGATVILLVVKELLGYQVAGRMLPLTVTEAVAVSVTVLLARQVAMTIHQFEESVYEVAAFHWVQKPLSFKELQRDFYREVRRARQYNRPVALLALKPPAARPPQCLSRVIEEVNQRMAQDHVDAEVADLLASQLRDSELVAKDNDEFLVLLPEADRERALEVAEQLTAQVRELLGTEVGVGVATFPNQETTLNGLLERAQASARMPLCDMDDSQAFDNDSQSAECVLIT